MALLEGNGCIAAFNLLDMDPPLGAKGAVGAEVLNCQSLTMCVNTRWLDQLLMNGMLCASAGGHIGVLQRLFKVNGGVYQGEHLKIRSRDGCTPHYLACQNNHVDTAKLLIKRRGDLNQPQKDGATPLFVACQKGHLEIVKLLVDAQGLTTLDTPTNQGLTPLGAAIRNGHEEVAAVLRAHHATEPGLPLLVVGDHIKVVGLSKGTQYNGRTGTVDGSLNTGGRLQVQLWDEDGADGTKGLMLRPTNLELVVRHPGVGDCTANPPRGTLDPTGAEQVQAVASGCPQQ